MNDKKEDLCIYRIRNAVETLGVAVLCLESQHYKDSINRSYYAAFYAIKKDTKRIFFPSCIFLIFCISIFLIKGKTAPKCFFRNVRN